MARHPKHDQVGEVRRIMKRQLSSFKTVFDTAEREGIISQAQRTYDDVDEFLRQLGDDEEIVSRITTFTGSLKQTLREQNVDEAVISDVQKHIEQNWLLVVKERRDVDLGCTVKKALKEWEAKANAPLPHGMRVRKICVGSLKLAAGAGAFVFDTAKFLHVAPVPGYMFGSFIAGAMFFVDGVDKIWEGATG